MDDFLKRLKEVQTLHEEASKERMGIAFRESGKFLLGAVTFASVFYIASEAIAPKLFHNKDIQANSNATEQLIHPKP